MPGFYRPGNISAKIFRALMEYIQRLRICQFEALAGARHLTAGMAVRLREAGGRRIAGISGLSRRDHT